MYYTQIHIHGKRKMLFFDITNFRVNRRVRNVSDEPIGNKIENIIRCLRGYYIFVLKKLVTNMATYKSFS